MNCRLVFFAARKTSLCEKSLKKVFPLLNLSLAGASFAADGGTLCDELTKAFELCPLTFAVGGLGLDSRNGIKSVIEGSLARSSVTECKKLKNTGGNDGYLIRCGGQLLIILPDEPEQIEEIMQGVTGKYVEAFAKQQSFVIK